VKNVLHGVDFQDSGFCQISRFFPDHPTFGRIFLKFFSALLGQGLQNDTIKFHDFKHFFSVQPYLKVYFRVPKMQNIWSHTIFSQSKEYQR
jgi:hypothetical protein